MGKISATSDGENTEGIGSMVQLQIWCYSYAKQNQHEYIFNGFKGLTHYQPYNISQERWCDDWNSFFNIPINSSPSDEIKPTILSRHASLTANTANMVYNDAEYFRNKITYTNDKQFDKNIINIAVHIRKFNTIDNSNDIKRELYTPNSNKEQYFLNVIKAIDGFLMARPHVFHIYSQGSQEDFQSFIKLNIYGKVILHIEEYPIISLYHMINSDIFVASNSALSYITTMLSKKICIVRNTYFQKFKSADVGANINGNFNIETLKWKFERQLNE